MKKIITVVMVAMISLTTLQTKAQAFDKSSILLTLAIGPGDMIHFPEGSNNPLSGANNGFLGLNVNRAILTGQLAFQAEFAVHKYVGVGFVVGLGGRAQNNGAYNVYTGLTALGYYKEVNIPVGVLANFHFFQLIADKKGLELGNKLDVYAGLTAGSGVAIHPYKNSNGGVDFNDALLFVGPHAGVNYYFANNVAVHGEVGWGTTVLQAGFTFKLGGGGSKKK